MTNLEPVAASVHERKRLVAGPEGS